MATTTSRTSRGDIKLNLGSPEVSGHASREANRALAAAARSGAPGNLVLPCGTKVNVLGATQLDAESFV